MKRFVLFCMLGLMTTVAMPQPPARHGDNRPHSDRHRPQHVEQQYVRYCATAEQMQMVMQVLKSQSFDDKKLEVANMCVAIGSFCVDDLAQMAEAFSFDDNRLAFLKFAHAYCVDPENYPMLHNCFTFRSNYDNLMEYIYPGWKK